MQNPDQNDTSPFSRSSKLSRTPTKLQVVTRQAAKIKEKENSTNKQNTTNCTKSDGTKEPPTLVEQKKNTTTNIPETEDKPSKSEESTEVTTAKPDTRISKVSHEIQKQTEKMNPKELQQSIANFVPEFSGENINQRSTELTRFIGTADSIYNELNNDEDRATFNKIIKFRLTGDAYNRISHREVNDYATLKEILQNMYLKTQSLSELERTFTTLTQSYGETCRNYGYRLIEAMERYKSAYKARYETNNIDDSYAQHLNNTAIHTYKRGINNLILKEKIATSTARTIDDIIKETENMDRMLEITTNTQQIHTPQINNTPYQRTSTTLTCNYCQKPNHTYNACRTRMYEEARARRNQMHQTNNSQQRQNVQPNTRFNTATNYQNNYTLPRMNNNDRPYAQQQSSPYAPRQQFNPNFSQQNQLPNRRIFTPKYCTHCKTTTGHTYEECRNKFYSNRNSTNNNQPQERSPVKELEDRLGRMQIRYVANQQLEPNIPHQTQNAPHQSENFRGSST